MSPYQRRAAATAIFRAWSAVAAGTTLKRWWVAYILWRVERLAVTQSYALGDRDLEDVELVGRRLAPP